MKKFCFGTCGCGGEEKTRDIYIGVSLACCVGVRRYRGVEGSF